MKKKNKAPIIISRGLNTAVEILGELGYSATYCSLKTVQKVMMAVDTHTTPFNCLCIILYTDLFAHANFAHGFFNEKSPSHI